MKKEVIILKDGEQFKREIEKIIRQANGKKLYIDDELVLEIKKNGDCSEDMMIFEGPEDPAGYTIIISKTDTGFYQIKGAAGFIKGGIYFNPQTAEKAVLVMLA